MAATTQQDWHAEALDLRTQGLSEREIAEAVGKAPSTVHDFLAKSTVTGPDPDPPIPGQQTIDGGEIDPTDVSAAVERFKEEAGEPVGPMPPKQPESTSVYIEQIRVDGTTQIAIDFGGKQASSCKLSISGGADVDGFFKKGDRIRGTFEAVIDGAGAKDKIDKPSGVVMEAVQTNHAKIVDLVIE